METGSPSFTSAIEPYKENERLLETPRSEEHFVKAIETKTNKTEEVQILERSRSREEDKIKKNEKAEKKEKRRRAEDPERLKARKQLRELSNAACGSLVKENSVIFEKYWRLLLKLEIILPRSYNFSFCKTCNTILDHNKRVFHSEKKCELKTVLSLKDFRTSPESFKDMILTSCPRFSGYVSFPRFGADPVEHDKEYVKDILFKRPKRVEMSNLSGARSLQKKNKTSLGRFKDKLNLKSGKGSVNVSAFNVSDL